MPSAPKCIEEVEDTTTIIHHTINHDTTNPNRCIAVTEVGSVFLLMQGVNLNTLLWVNAFLFSIPALMILKISLMLQVQVGLRLRGA